MRIPISLCRAVGSIALSITAVACSSENALNCTEEFRIYGVYVVDGAGFVLPGLDYTVTISNLGHEVEVDSTVAPPANGWYPLVTDAQGALLGQTGSLVRFDGTDGTLTTTGDYLFVAGLCHVEKLSGPDTLVAQ
jgi:hypothetical protein